MSYEEQINRLIPAAQKHADLNAGDKFFDRATGWKNRRFKSHDDWAEAWNVLFHGEMSRLAHEAGLRNLPVGRK